MKRTFLIAISVALCSVAFAQKIEYQEAATRNKEPLQDVYIRPMAAELKMLTTERKSYPVKQYHANYKLIDIISHPEMLESAKTLAIYDALMSEKEKADVIIGATYLVTHHIENGKISEYGIDVVVHGYPAKYVNWHLMGEKPTDKEWVPYVISSQSISHELGKEAVRGR